MKVSNKADPASVEEIYAEITQQEIKYKVEYRAYCTQRLTCRYGSMKQTKGRLPVLERSKENAAADLPTEYLVKQQDINNFRLWFPRCEPEEIVRQMITPKQDIPECSLQVHGLQLKRTLSACVSNLTPTEENNPAQALITHYTQERSENHASFEHSIHATYRSSSYKSSSQLAHVGNSTELQQIARFPTIRDLLLPQKHPHRRRIQK